MKRIVTVVAVTLLWSLPAMAETYSWTDRSGTVNFSDDYYSVPKQYRKKVRRLGDIDAQPAAADSGKGAGAGQQAALPEAGKGGAGEDSANDQYGGKKAEIWQQEFKGRYAEVKQLEKELLELEELVKKPVGISRERIQGLPQEFRATQKRYNDAVKAYNELNDAANKVGLPAEYRK
ncbi:DUF4124 domain-containing protein [Geobacter sp. FeAm09]|uniref:DUF4124 domain-containing protein n=1 Tax=Geobacter sp. FeAm09 TaxID=2597769 RepID=UPI00143CD365|nr:DUF4124 domain-containing protein [Geobacter sp. FeAm09]